MSIYITTHYPSFDKFLHTEEVVYYSEDLAKIPDPIKVVETPTVEEAKIIIRLVVSTLDIDSCNRDDLRTDILYKQVNPCQSCELEEGSSEHSCPMAEMRGDKDESFCNCCDSCTGNCNNSV